MLHKNKTIFSRNCNGATAVEFALIFPIFFLIIFSIIEFAMIMIVQSTISGAALDASRYGTTGNIYGKKISGRDMTRRELVENTINDKMSILPFYDPVKNRVAIQLNSLGTIGSPKARAPISTSKNSTGKADEVIEYKITYQWNILSPIMYPILGKSGKYDISASTIIKNESFINE